MEINPDIPEKVDSSVVKDAKTIVSEYGLDTYLLEMYNSVVYERSKQPALFMVSKILLFFELRFDI